jgi:hypothetical protein
MALEPFDERRDEIGPDDSGRVGPEDDDEDRPVDLDPWDEEDSPGSRW